MMFFVLSGFGKAGAHVDTMFTLALIITGFFFYLNHGPFRAFKMAADARDFATAGQVLQKVRKIVATNLALGILTICWTENPVMCASGRIDLTLANIASAATFTASSFSRLRATPPTSDLWEISGEIILSTTG